MIEKLWRLRKSKSILNFVSSIIFCHFSFFRAEQEAKITSEKDEHIKSVEAEILQLKADIYNLKVEISQEFQSQQIELFRMFIENIQCMENFWLLYLLKIGEKSK